MADVVLGISRWVRGAAKEEDMLLLVGARLLIVKIKGFIYEEIGRESR